MWRGQSRFHAWLWCRGDGSCGLRLKECQARALPWETADLNVDNKPALMDRIIKCFLRRQSTAILPQNVKRVPFHGKPRLVHARQRSLRLSRRELTQALIEGSCLDASFLTLDAAYVEQYFPYDHDASRSFLCILIFCLRAAMGPDIGSPLEHCGAFRFCRDGCMLATRCSIVDCYDAIDGH